jgi:hypothetical protein
MNSLVADYTHHESGRALYNDGNSFDNYPYRMVYRMTIDDLDTYIEASRVNYTNKLGATMTSGKEIIHFAPLTKENEFDWDDEMRLLNPDLYDKYLKIYEWSNNE